LKIIGLDTHPKRTFVWIPSLDTVVGGVPVYGNVHLWIADSATSESRQDWYTILDRITALKPTTVIPGHATQDAPKTLESVNFTRKYLETYEKELAKAKTSKDLIAAMDHAYPNAVLPIALNIGAKVATGEMQW